MSILVGIDLGTTNIKVSAYDPQGNLLASASKRNVITYHETGWSEFDAEAIWQSVTSGLQEISSACGGGISAVGISSFGESNVLLDSNGNIVYPMITWFDPRTTEEVDQITQSLSPKEIHQITGQFVSPKLGICKVMWIQKHYPEEYARATLCLTMLDYIIYRLTGTAGMDYTMASRMMLLDIHTLQYAQSIIQASGLRRELFPPIRPSGSVAGHITPTLCGELGLSGEIPVFAGGHDHACAAIAAHIYDEGIALDSMGTAETMLISSETLPDLQACFENQVSVYPHFGQKLYRLTTSIQACGSCLAWANTQLLSNGVEQANLSTLSSFLQQSLDAPKRLRPVFCPNIRGLQESPATRGAFLGITDACTCQDLAYAVVEGLVFESFRRFLGCFRASGIHFSGLRVVGGPSSLQNMMQMKSDIFEQTIQIPVIRDAACLGAAIIAGMGIRILQQPPRLSIQVSYAPNRARFDEYQKRYAQYERAISLSMQYIAE